METQHKVDAFFENAEKERKIKRTIGGVVLLLVVAPILLFVIWAISIVASV